MALGTPDDVRVRLRDAFPGAEFAVEDGQIAKDMARSSSLSLGGFLLRLLVRPHPWPRCIGRYQGDGFAVEFDFPQATEVRRVGVTLYGRDTALAND
jgi:hypothetical protein